MEYEDKVATLLDAVITSIHPINLTTVIDLFINKFYCLSLLSSTTIGGLISISCI